MISRLIRRLSIGFIVMCAFSVVTAAAATSANGTLNFSASTYTVSQTAASMTVTVTRTGGAGDAASINYLTSGNTALLDVNYVHTAGTLSWASGDSSAKTVTVPLIKVASFTGSKSFYLTLSGAKGAAAGSPSVATLVITGNGSTGGALEFATSAYQVAQNTASITLSVTRTGGSAGAASIAYLTSGNTALVGVDYVHTAGTLAWASGDTTAKSVTVPLIGRPAYTGNKSFYLTLSNADGATAGAPAVATITIVGAGSGSGSKGVISLSAATYAVAQNAGALTVTVNRSGGSAGAASVGYGTGNSTAVAGKDFTAESGQLTWANGDMSPKTFSVPISNATPFTGSKVFAVAIASATGATLGTPASGIVTITGDGKTAPTTGTATLTWIAPTLNTDGTPLTNLAGYRISYGTNANSLTNVITIGNANTTSYEISNLNAGTWYFTIEAYNTQGIDSAPSASASTSI